MIDSLEIEKVLNKNQDVDFINVTSDGYHYNLVIVSDIFVGKSLRQRQQWVYTHLKNYITSGEIHALTMATWTIAEWQQKQEDKDG